MGLTRDEAAAVERAVLGIAWADTPDGDPDDLLEPSAALRLPAAAWDAAAADLVGIGPARVLGAVRRLEGVGVGPPGGVLRGSPSVAWLRLARELALLAGSPVVRLAAATVDALGRFESGPVAADGVPGVTVTVTLEPTTDGVWMGLATRSGAGPDLDVVLTVDDPVPVAVRIPAELPAVVFYLDRDPGASPRVWCGRA